MEMYFFTEYELYSNSLNLKNSYEMKDFYQVKDGKVQFFFCGSVYTDNTVITVFPKGFELENEGTEDKIEYSKLLYKIFVKYNKRSILKNNNSEYEKNINRNNYLTIAEAVVKDYLQHDLIKEKIKKRSLNGPGKTNWNMTFKKVKPLFVNESLFYMDLVNERNFNLITSEIIGIHQYILKDITNKAGWILDFNYNKKTLTKVNISKAMILLKQAMKLTYNVNLLHRLNLLYQYLNIVSKSKNQYNIEFLYTFKFQYIWEDMCKMIFSHNKLLASEIPNYEWSYMNDFLYEAKLIPDIVTLFSEEELVIMDAKYYSDAEKEKNLPPSGDISKQFMYQLAFETKSEKKFKEIYNFFLIPGSSEGTHYFHEIADAEISGFKYSIKALIVDLKYSMKCYLSTNIEIKQFLYEYTKNK